MCGPQRKRFRGARRRVVRTPGLTRGTRSWLRAKHVALLPTDLGMVFGHTVRSRNIVGNTWGTSSSHAPREHWLIASALTSARPNRVQPKFRPSGAARSVVLHSHSLLPIAHSTQHATGTQHANVNPELSLVWPAGDTRLLQEARKEATARMEEAAQVSPPLFNPRATRSLTLEGRPSLHLSHPSTHQRINPPRQRRSWARTRSCACSTSACRAT